MEERIMELEALKSIYEDDLSSSNSGSTVVCGVNLEDCRPVSLNFSLQDDYPHAVPAISVMSRGTCVKELESHLQRTAENSRGEVMLYTLIEEAKNWLRKSQCPQEKGCSLIDGETETAQPEKRSEVCQFFLNGKCRFGSKCFNKHELTDQGKSDSSLEDESLHSQIKQVQLDDGPTQRESGEVPRKSAQGSEIRPLNTVASGTTTKKRPMKTASDVISRIQWDEKLDERDFVLGYLDRFVGIVEKPFEEFSWEDLASVDYNTLSIPQHRIQYFKYCGQIIWDKRHRVDRVFGSTGSGETILDVMSSPGSATELCEEVASIEQKSSLHVPKVEDVTSGPNYHVSVEITDTELCNQVQKLQQSVCAMEPRLACGMIPKSSLHVTLLMLTLKNDNDVTVAKQVLKAVQPVMASLLPPTQLLDFQDLSSFKDRILHIPLKPNPGLEALATALKYKFHQAGICLDGNHNEFVPHLTVVRVIPSNATSPKIYEIFTSLKTSYHSHMFGQNNVHSISLWSKSAPNNQGSHKLLTVENSMSAVSSMLSGKLIQHLEKLYMEGACNESERDELNKLLSTTDACDLENALCKLAQLCQGTSSSMSSDQTRVLLILRGLHGSGKTHLAENSKEAKEQGRMRIVSSCQLFQRRGDPAFVDPSEMTIAEAYCRTRFLEALEASVPLVVIDDVHSQLWEYAMYKHVARAFGYTCHALELHCSQPKDIQACHQYCSPHQSLEHLLELTQGWQQDPAAVAIKPWFKDPRPDRATCRSLLQLIGLHT